MGDISEMMIDGTLCSCCAEFIGEGDGFPRECDGCSKENKKREKVKQ